jgi:hypothetical protein
MGVTVTKQEINIREKLTELEGKQNELVIRPAFSCAGGGSYTPTTGAQNISSFCGGTVIFDHGGNLDNGKFTAPMTGLYHFDLKLQVVYSSGYFFSYVYKNGATMPNHNMQFYQTSNTYTLSFTTFAKEGDYFEPYIQNNYAGGTASSPIWCGHYIG